MSIFTLPWNEYTTQKCIFFELSKKWKLGNISNRACCLLKKLCWLIFYLVWSSLQKNCFRLTTLLTLLFQNKRVSFILSKIFLCTFYPDKTFYLLFNWLKMYLFFLVVLQTPVLPNFQNYTLVISYIFCS